MAGLVSRVQAPVTPAPAAAQSSPMNAPAPAQGQGGGIPPLQDPILKQVEAQIEAKVAPAIRPMYTGILLSCMKLAFDPKTHDLLLQGLKSTPDVAKNISLICTGMVAHVYEQAKQDPAKFIQAAIPASLSLMCQILQFAEQAQMIQATPDVVSQCSQATTSTVLAKFGIDQSKVQQAVNAGKQSAGSATPSAPAAPAPAASAVGA